MLQHLELKAAITGAISAIYIYEDAKSTGVAPLLKSPEEAAIYGVDKVRRGTGSRGRLGMATGGGGDSAGPRTPTTPPANS